MATDIETFLFGKGGTHGVTAIGLSADRLTLAVAPWESGTPPMSVAFTEPKLLSVEVFADGSDDLSLPWDIIGFDSYVLSRNRWKFVLHCAGIEYVFSSMWPERIAG